MKSFETDGIQVKIEMPEIVALTIPNNQPDAFVPVLLVVEIRNNTFEIFADDRELIMQLEPLYQRNREQAKQEGLLEGIQQGRQEGRQEGKQDLILRQLNRRIGEIDASLIKRVQGSSLKQLENLGEALLDFSTVVDLETWFNQI